MADGSRDLAKQAVSGSSTPGSHGLSPDALQSPRTLSPAAISRKDSSLSSTKVGNDTPSSLGDPIRPHTPAKSEMTRPSKPSRAASQKFAARPPPLFLDEQDRYEEATSLFSVIEDSIYFNKYLGSTEPALECDCGEEWDGETQANQACGPESDCINRATKMECIDDCSCGQQCQNMRFQHKQWANVTVMKTEKKGYGLRANEDLEANDFIFEYIGEVINEQHFRRRMTQYDEAGIKHFYFMSLSKGEYIDATKKGNLGRFCNHSCNPNCYVDKWVVGEKLRMGIFAERNIKAGEELVFNYNVDRYGADPQPCYCGEPNCTGFLGGKTQTETGPKLSNATIEALGIDDFDGWDFIAPTRPKKARKTGEDDEDYVNDAQPRSLEETGVTKVMATLMQCKEKWIAVKLLNRIQRAGDERIMHRVVRMHGYRILKTALINFMEDANVCLQVLDVLFKLPRITRNKIQDSGIEETVQKLSAAEDERVVKQSAEILDIWSQLEVAYRIPKLKRDPTASGSRPERVPERRDARARSRSPPKEPVAAPTGPKNSIPSRKPLSFGPGGAGRGGPPFRPRNFSALPVGWFSTTANGKVYYYSLTGQTTWIRPTEPAVKPRPQSPKADVMSNEQKIQAIINSITKAPEKSNKSPATSTSGTPKKDALNHEKKEERWRSYSEEKQKKIYENTLHPHIMYVVNKFKSKLPKEDLKRFAKECCKKLTNSDFKHGRVQDPQIISKKQERNVKMYMKEYLDKAVVKHREYEKRKREKEARATGAGAESLTTPMTISPARPRDKEETAIVEDDEEIKLTDNEDDEEQDGVGKKRKEMEDEQEDDSSNSKRARTGEETPVDTPPPPPPPPPPVDDALMEKAECADSAGSEGGENGYHHEREMLDEDDSTLTHELRAARISAVESI